MDWDPVPDTSAWGPAAPLLTTLRDVAGALRRWWLVVVLAAMVGMGAGLAYGAWLGSSSTATATIFLAHDPALDESTAMATDEQLVHARPVAQLAIDRLGLEMAPEDLQAGIGTVVLTPQLLQLEVSAPDPSTATRNATVVADAFLDFRAKQLVTQAKSVADQLREQAADLKSQSADLLEQWNRLSNGTAAEQSEAEAVNEERTRAGTRISDLEQQIEEISVNADAVVAASSVVDPPAIREVGPLRQWALPAVSGLIGGAALAVGALAMLTVVSGGVRTRSAVAAALGVPVRYAVGRTTGWSPFAMRTRRRNLSLVAAGLREEGFGHPGTVSVLAAIDASREANRVMRAFVRGHPRGGTKLHLVDLTERGLLTRRSWKRRNHSSGGQLHLVRPAGSIPFARPQAERLERGSPLGAPGQATIVLAEVDPGIGVMALASWSDTAVLLVACGRTTFERLQATAESFDALGPRLELAVLVNADVREVSQPGGLVAGEGVATDE